ncbi:Fructosamine kinase-domain-containing protein [Xylariaceae sp. FL1651]|nr:Fructosamine kinase-domain-containing protein [Xylariaceae sp. FL1651]
MAELSEWVSGIQGNFPLHRAVVDVMPKGTRVISAESSGISAWTKTAKVTVIWSDGHRQQYFLKCSTGDSSRALAEGEYHSAAAMNRVIAGFVPKPIGWGKYENEGEEVHFFLGVFHDMDFSTAPEPADFVAKIADIHRNGTSPNGMFGYPVPTVIGRMQRTVTWEKSWAASFTYQLKDVIGYDNETNGPWPELEAACNQLIDKVIPRLLGALQSEGREIVPSLIHGDLWERNVGIDMETGETILFDPGCTYAHNEMEFGTWRCTWATYFNSPVYMRLYQEHIEPSEPAEEWDDRNRLYSVHPYLTDSAGHPGSASRQIAYNDILYLCEKYAPLDSLQKYDPKKDVTINKTHIPFIMRQLE